MKSSVKLFFKVLIIFSIFTIFKYSMCDTHNITDPKTRRERFCSGNLQTYLISGFIALILIIFVFKL